MHWIAPQLSIRSDLIVIRRVPFFFHYVLLFRVQSVHMFKLRQQNLAFRVLTVRVCVCYIIRNIGPDMVFVNYFQLSTNSYSSAKELLHHPAY